VGIPVHWGTLIPSLQHSTYGSVVLDNQFESLVRRGRNGVIEPSAAKSWSLSKDHLTIRFMIDTARRFSDGSRLSAGDFKRCWEDGLRMAPKSKNASLADGLFQLQGFDAFEEKGTIEGVRVLSDEVLELRLTKPARVAVEFLSGLRFAVYKMASGGPIGTGPFVMEEKDEVLTLSRNPYFRGDEVRFDKMTLRVIPKDQMKEKLVAGEIDAALFVPVDVSRECFARNFGAVKCEFGQEAAHSVVIVNGLPGRFFSIAEHRLAVQFLIQREFQSGPRPKAYEGDRFIADSQTFLKFQPGRLSDRKAAELVREGERYVGAMAEASRQSPIYVACGPDCSWLVELLRRAGVSVSDNSGRIDFSTRVRMFYKTYEPDLLTGSLSVFNGDPDGIYHALGTNGAIFTPMSGRAEVSELLESGRQVLDHSKLKPHYEKVARAILTQVPFVHLGFSYRGIAYDSSKIRIAESFLNRNNHRLSIFAPL